MKKVAVLLMVALLSAALAGCKAQDKDADIVNNKAPEGTVTILEEKENISDTVVETDSSYSADWSDISANGLNEASFLEKLDTEILEDVALKIQTMVDEEVAEESENPEIVLSEGFVRVFKTENYQEVISIGERAEMPLYYILYKSNSDGMYEFICATALSELTGLDFMNESGAYYDWTSGKEYLELFNEYMLSNPDD